MKKYNNLLHNLRPALLGVLAAGFVACTSDILEMDGGKLPSDKPGEPTGALYSVESSAIESAVNIYSGESEITAKLVYRLTAPVEKDVQITIEALGWDLPTCETWNLANGYGKYPWNERDGYTLRKKGTGYSVAPEKYLRPYPTAALTLPDGGIITIPAGKTTSAEIPIVIPTDQLVEYSNYILPLKVTTVTGVEAAIKEQTILIKIKFYPAIPTILSWPEIDISKLGKNPHTTLIGYIDVSKYKPSVACAFYTQVTVSGPWFEVISDDFYRAFDLINLVKAEVKFDKGSGRALLTPTSDLKYVLTHRQELLDPVRNFGIQVCLAIQGGKTGIGFCNMDDTQIKDFVAQVKAFCTQYNLDGINLWDKNSSYGREGMAAVNTTSYPKLIKALREALGTNKLITIADDGDPTASFYDAALCGGIEVGKLVDYVHEARSFTLTNPWDSASDRKAFAGLKKERYGTFYKAERAPLAQENETPLYDQTKVYAAETGLTKVGATDINAFLHGAEEEHLRHSYWYINNCFSTFNEVDFSGINHQFTPVEYFFWGQYSNNYYYKDWD